MSKLYNFIYKWNLDYFHQQQYAEAWIERNIHDITVRDMWLFGFVAVLACVIVCFMFYTIFKELRYIKKGGGGTNAHILSSERWYNAYTEVNFMAKQQYKVPKELQTESVDWLKMDAEIMNYLHSNGFKTIEDVIDRQDEIPHDFCVLIKRKIMFGL